MKYTIGRFSQLTGINSATLRYYEQEGLMLPRRDQGNQYRYYDDQNLMEAYRIKTLRNYGFSMEGLKMFNEEYDAKERWYQARIEEVTNQIRQLETVRKQLELALFYYRFSAMNINVSYQTLSGPHILLCYDDGEKLGDQMLHRMRQWENNLQNVSLCFLIKEEEWKSRRREQKDHIPLELHAGLYCHQGVYDGAERKAKPLFRQYARQKVVCSHMLIHELSEITLEKLEPLFSFAEQNGREPAGDILLHYGGSQRGEEKTMYIVTANAFLHS